MNAVFLACVPVPVLGHLGLVKTHNAAVK